MAVTQAEAEAKVVQAQRQAQIEVSGGGAVVVTRREVVGVSRGCIGARRAPERGRARPAAGADIGDREERRRGGEAGKLHGEGLLVCFRMAEDGVAEQRV